MNPIFNTKFRFYDYFPHITPVRMKELFQLGFFEQSVIRDEIQRVISAAYKNLVNAHDLVHVNIYDEIGDEFDDNFYRELKTIVQTRFHSEGTWLFLDNLLTVKEIEDDEEYDRFQTKMQSILGFGLRRSLSSGKIQLKDALMALFNYDLDPLNGRELKYLTKIQ